MPAADGIQRAVKQMLGMHDVNRYDHATATLKQLRDELTAFLDDCTSDPLLLAYDLQTPLETWTTLLLKVSRWSNYMIEHDSPLIPFEGAK